MGFVHLPKLRDIRVPSPHAKAQTPVTENTPRRRRADRDPSYRTVAEIADTKRSPDTPINPLNNVASESRTNSRRHVAVGTTKKSAALI
jgi:hypothetical protein